MEEVVEVGVLCTVSCCLIQIDNYEKKKQRLHKYFSKHKVSRHVVDCLQGPFLERTVLNPLRFFGKFGRRLNRPLNI